VVQISAEQPAGPAIPIHKTRKNRWAVETGGAPRVVVRYRVYSHAMHVQDNYVDSEMALLNGQPSFLTLAENFLIGAKLSEYHTGYRAFSRQLLERLPLQTNSDDFVFDNQILAQIVALDCAIGEVTCPARYMPEASSINFRRSVRYGLGCLATAVRFRLARWGLVQPIV